MSQKLIRRLYCWALHVRPCYFFLTTSVIKCWLVLCEWNGLMVLLVIKRYLFTMSSSLMTRSRSMKWIHWSHLRCEVCMYFRHEWQLLTFEDTIFQAKSIHFMLNLRRSSKKEKTCKYCKGAFSNHKWKLELAINSSLKRGECRTFSAAKSIRMWKKQPYLHDKLSTKLYVPRSNCTLRTIVILKTRL